MYLPVYPSVNGLHPPRLGNRAAQLTAPEFDFITPDGQVVPRALGEAALHHRTAVLIGELLVGMWPKA